MPASITIFFIAPRRFIFDACAFARALAIMLQYRIYLKARSVIVELKKIALKIARIYYNSTSA